MQRIYLQDMKGLIYLSRSIVAGCYKVETLVRTSLSKQSYQLINEVYQTISNTTAFDLTIKDAEFLNLW